MALFAFTFFFFFFSVLDCVHSYSPWRCAREWTNTTRSYSHWNCSNLFCAPFVCSFMWSVSITSTSHYRTMCSRVAFSFVFYSIRWSVAWAFYWTFRRRCSWRQSSIHWRVFRLWSHPLHRWSMLRTMDIWCSWRTPLNWCIHFSSFVDAKVSMHWSLPFCLACTRHWNGICLPSPNASRESALTKQSNHFVYTFCHGEFTNGWCDIVHARHKMSTCRMMHCQRSLRNALRKFKFRLK